MGSTLASVSDGWNPAHLSPELSALFPAGVIAAQLLQPAPIDLLTSQEIASVSRGTDRRIRHFAAGRLCARRALEALGVLGFSLLAAPDRQPIWPPGIVGSISHTEGCAVAVVGRRGALHSLGVDCESVAALDEELWPHLYAASELRRLRALQGQRRAVGAALIFAAKEAFYKSQFPLTGEWVDFQDVLIETDDQVDSDSGCFRVLPQRQLALNDRLAGELRGRYRLHGPFVTAGIALQD